MELMHSNRLLRRVGGRKRLISLGRSAYLGTLVLAGVYALLFVLVRLLGLMPAPWISQWLLLAVPVMAALGGLALHRRPVRREAARTVDGKMNTKDLFLTTAMIQGTPGAYQSLVVEAAERRAPKIRPETVVPYEPWQKAGYAALALGALWIAVVSPMQFDPFGIHEKTEKMAERREQLDLEKQETARRANQLKRKDLDAENARAVEEALNDLKLAFHKMNPRDKPRNLQRMKLEHRKLENLWRMASERKRQLQSSLHNQSTAQRLGAPGSLQKTRQWKNDLNQGSAESLKNELQQSKELAEQLAASKNSPAKRQELRKQLKNRLKQLAEFANLQGLTPQLSATLAQAMRQAAMSSVDGLSQQSMDAMMETLDLAQLEADQLAQTIRDMQALEDAMQAMQQAKVLNELQMLDGRMCEGCNGMGDYMRLYAELLAQCDAQGFGGGPLDGPLLPSLGDMRGPGRGRGGIAPVDRFGR